jgi:hypothetical protein
MQSRVAWLQHATCTLIMICQESVAPCRPGRDRKVSPMAGTPRLSPSSIEIRTGGVACQAWKWPQKTGGRRWGMKGSGWNRVRRPPSKLNLCIEKGGWATGFELERDWPAIFVCCSVWSAEGLLQWRLAHKSCSHNLVHSAAYLNCRRNAAAEQRLITSQQKDDNRHIVIIVTNFITIRCLLSAAKPESFGAHDRLLTEFPRNPEPKCL